MRPNREEQMPEADYALGKLEDALNGVLSFVRASSYGLRVAGKRLGDLTLSAGGSPLPGPRGKSEMSSLAESVEQAEKHLSDVVALALGDHFRSFLARALAMDALPPLPPSVDQVEILAGTPGAFPEPSFWFALGLMLYHAALNGGSLDARTLSAFGNRELEVPYPGGKVKLFGVGDRVTLTEGQFETLGRAYLDAARTIRLRLLTC